MRLITLLTAAMATLATAAPVATETVSVSDIWVRKDETATSSKISHVEFKLNGPGAKDLLCTRSNPSLPSGTFPCGKSGYTFQLKKGVNKADYAVTLHHKHKDG